MTFFRAAPLRLARVRTRIHFQHPTIAPIRQNRRSAAQAEAEADRVSGVIVESEAAHTRARARKLSVSCVLVGSELQSARFCLHVLARRSYLHRSGPMNRSQCQRSAALSKGPLGSTLKCTASSAPGMSTCS
eukprot:649193-Rhodomonas_salina.1